MTKRQLILDSCCYLYPCFWPINAFQPQRLQRSTGTTNILRDLGLLQVDSVMHGSCFVGLVWALLCPNDITTIIYS